MKIGSLFSGIGGLELGLERAGLGPVVYQVERDAYARHVLARHWPSVARFDDVRSVGVHNLPAVELLCGGFPCQDLSAAGLGVGLQGSRSGLWFEMHRIINETRPGWIVVENVAHTWRRYVPELRRSLWALGYASLPLRVRACDVGARHERARIFIIGGPAADVDGIAVRLQSERPEARRLDLSGREKAESGTDAADDAGLGLAVGRDLDCDCDEELQTPAGGPGERAAHVAPGFGLPSRPWMVRGVHGLPRWVDGARGSGWTAARVREARIRALGNAVVPACAEVVGRVIAAACSGPR